MSRIGQRKINFHRVIVPKLIDLNLTMMLDNNVNKKIIVIILLVFIAGGYLWYNSNTSKQLSTDPSAEQNDQMQGDPESDEMKKDVDEIMMEEMKQMTYMYSGVLSDVTEGELRGISTNGQASGIAKADFNNGKYMVLTTFENLPDSIDDDFYEGWIVQKEPFKFISTGRVEKVDGVYINTYSSGKDLTSYSRYVLTIEPDDGDPAPAVHIVEGDMIKQ